MISSPGNYVFDFQLGDSKSFITEENLHQFTLVSDAGAGQPMFALSFDTDKSGIFKFLNEGNLLQILYGTGIKSAKKSKFRILGDPEIIKNGNHKYTVAVTGLYDLPNYLGNTTIITDKLSAAEVINQKYQKLGLELDTKNIQTSLDSQNWVQFGCSDRRFLMDTAMHMDLGKSTPLLAITKQGVLRLYDLLKVVKEPPKWRFVTKTSKPNDILYTGSPEFLKDKSNLINFWQGYSSNLPVTDLLTLTQTQYNEEIQNLLTLASTLPRAVQEEIRLEEIKKQNDNVHKNFWRSFQHNLKFVVLFSRNGLGLKFTKVFKDVEPLDLIYYEDADTGVANLRNKYTSGHFIVTRSVLTLLQKQISTYVEVYRESMNNIQGDLQ